MALYAMGDLHLSFSVDKSMDIFGGAWKNHEKKIEKNCRKIIRPDDTLVLTGDHSWGEEPRRVREGFRVHRGASRQENSSARQS